MSKPYNKSTGRDYSYDKLYEKSHKQIKNRAARNHARAEILSELAHKFGKSKAKAKLKGKDIDHKKALADGGSTNRSNLQILSAHANRAKKPNHLKHQ